MSRIIPTNSHVLAMMNSARAIFNATCSFRLYNFPIPLTPALTLANMGEATFPGYIRWPTTNKFPAPFKVLDGLYQSSSAPFSYTVTGPTTETIYGFYIVRAGVLALLGSFPTPRLLAEGMSFDVVCDLQEGSLALAPPTA